jgi:hypothetical protein
MAVSDLERGVSPYENHQHSTISVDVSCSNYRRERVKPKLLQRPWLGNLDEFLDPDQKCFAVPEKHRLSFFDIKVIHISTSGNISQPIPCENLTQFEHAVGDVDPERIGSLILAEDLSQQMIDALGMKYDLEPEFFACHLEGTESARTGRWQRPTVRAPNLLPDCLRTAPFYSVEFRRPYHIPGGLGKCIQLRSTKTSVPRLVEVIKDGASKVYVFEKISVYKRKGAKIGTFNYWLDLYSY